MIATLIALGALAAPQQEGTSLFDGKTLGSWKATNYGGEGEVKVVDGAIRVEPGNPLTGIHWTGKDFPTTNYEVLLEAQKVDGNDFFCGLVFPVGKDTCSFVAGGWGGGVTGLSSVDHMNASENSTSTVQTYKKGQWYSVRLKVTPKKIEAWIDKTQVVDLELENKTISCHPAVEAAKPFGLAAFETTSLFRNLRLKALKQ